MAEHFVAHVADLPPGSRKIIEIGGRSIGVFNVNGRFYALRNVCPHQGAPLCLGALTGTAEPGPPGDYRWVRAGEILICPWHGWEFDITNGRSIFNPHRTRVTTYPVTVAPSSSDEGVETYRTSIEDGRVLIHL